MPERAFALTRPVARPRAGQRHDGRVTQAQSLVPPVLHLDRDAPRDAPGRAADAHPAVHADGDAEQSAGAGQQRRGQRRAAQGVPPGVPTVDQAAGAAQSAGRAVWMLDLLAQYPWLPLGGARARDAAARAAAARAAVAGRASSLAIVVAAAGSALCLLLRQWQTADAPAQIISEANQTPAAVDAAAEQPDFVLERARHRPSGRRPARPTAPRRSASRTRCAIRSRC